MTAEKNSLVQFCSTGFLHKATFRMTEKNSNNLGFGNRIEDPNNHYTKGITLSHKENPTKSPGWGHKRKRPVRQ
jgi:hypothetical protein